MKECLSLRPGVGIISGNNNYFIRTPNGNYKLQCNKEKIEEIETAIDEIAKNKSVELTPIIKMLKVIGVAYKKENNNSKNYEKTLDFYFYPINSLGRLLNRDKLNASNKQRGYYIYYCQKTAKVYVSKKTLKYKVLDLDSNLDFQKSFLKYILKRLSKNQQLMPTENDNFVMTMNVLDFRNNVDKLYLNVKNLQEIDSLLEFQPEFLNFKIDYDILFPMVTVIIKKNKETVYSVGPSKEFCFEMLYLKKNESNKVIKKSIEEALQNQLYQHEFQTIFNFINKKCSIEKVIDVEKVKWINKRIKNVI